MFIKFVTTVFLLQCCCNMQLFHQLLILYRSYHVASDLSHKPSSHVCMPFYRKSNLWPTANKTQPQPQPPSSRWPLGVKLGPPVIKYHITHKTSTQFALALKSCPFSVNCASAPVQCASARTHTRASFSSQSCARRIWSIFFGPDFRQYHTRCTRV